MTHDFRDVSVASSLIARSRGLMGRHAGASIFIPRCRAIHTFFVRARIDVLFVDNERRVTAIDANLAPWRVSIGPRTATSVLELPAGEAAKRGVATGDKILIG